MRNIAAMRGAVTIGLNCSHQSFVENAALGNSLAIAIVWPLSHTRERGRPFRIASLHSQGVTMSAHFRFARASRFTTAPPISRSPGPCGHANSVTVRDRPRHKGSGDSAKSQFATLLIVALAVGFAPNLLRGEQPLKGPALNASANVDWKIQIIPGPAIGPSPVPKADLARQAALSEVKSQTAEERYLIEA